MTWNQFKEQMESEDVEDSDELQFLDNDFDLHHDVRIIRDTRGEQVVVTVELP